MHDHMDDGGENPIVTTAYRMADALTYLMRVAARAGFRKTVVELSNVRADLISSVEENESSECTLAGKCTRNQGRKLS